ncbi:nuA3 HAT complex component nto1 [Kappamyces sp. JEL0829]|nr:nuA3 HAT complex component nto1 [Kappamyces sp. JEL0829]
MGQRQTQQQIPKARSAAPSDIAAEKTNNSAASRPANGGAAQGEEEIPREEWPMEDLFPDLNIGTLMQIDRIDCEHEHSHLHQEYIQNPLPVVQVSFSKPVPQPSYSQLANFSHSSLHEAESLPPFARFVEPSEDELAERVEYDMDEQDRNWLVAFNGRLKKLGEKECSFELFEFIMDQLEKEWFDLVKDIPKSSQVEHQYPEDISCAICDGGPDARADALDGEAENSNAIVFCDGCNLAVHQDCYGVPFIPEGCKCVLCPTEGGAYKKTTANKWAHLLCAMWIPECHISNTVFMEPIEGIESIQKSRWKLLCYICQKRAGAPIQCASKQCFVAFHASCARKAKLFMRMRGQDSNQFRAYCDRHCPKDYLDRVNVRYHLAMAQEELSRVSSSVVPVSSEPKFKRNPQYSGESKPNTPKGKKFSLTVPVIPAAILKSISSHHSALLPKKRSEIIIAISKYWSLKKESRRGAALLKRLHLEPWTANASASKEEDEIKAQKYEMLLIVRKDLEKVRILLDMVRKREKQKLRIYRSKATFFEYAYSPITPVLRVVLDKCMAVDKHQFFAHPVSAEDVPDYYSHIKSPMDFATISSKVDAHAYKSLDEFEADMNLICSNCLLYNKQDTIYAKAALKLRVYFQSILPVVQSQLDGIQEHFGDIVASL